MSSLRTMVLETVKRVSIPEELAQDAVEVLNLESYIQHTIELLVMRGSKNAHSVSEMWRRLKEEAKNNYQDFDENIHEVRFDHITKEVLIQKRTY